MPEINEYTLWRFRELLDYDKDTGILTWKYNRGGPVKRGDVAGSIGTGGYRYVKVDNYLYMAHHIAWYLGTGKWPLKIIDHRNRDRDDNRLENLREATPNQSAVNSGKKNNSSGFKGVSWLKGSGKWEAYVYRNYSRRRIGLYNSVVAAAVARNDAVAEMWGEFADVLTDKQIMEIAIKAGYIKSAMEFYEAIEETPRRKNTSGIRGVSWQSGRGMWVAQIFINGKQTNLGRYDCIIRAALAYNEAAREQWGINAPVTSYDNILAVAEKHVYKPKPRLVL